MDKNIKQQIINYYNSGKTIAEISRITGINHSTVRYNLMGITENKPLKEKSVAYKIAQLNNQGLSPIEIADKLEIGYKTVSSCISKLKKSGKIVASYDLEQEKLYNKVIELYKNGFTYKQIAEELGLQYENCHRIIKKIRKEGVKR